VLHGRHDDLFPIAGGEALGKAIKGATLTVFEESGHTPLLEEPERFNATLAELLGQ
jgi:proline iminopeptidase